MSERRKYAGVLSLCGDRCGQIATRSGAEVWSLDNARSEHVQLLHRETYRPPAGNQSSPTSRAGAECVNSPTLILSTPVSAIPRTVE